jgi:hypothetical protein
MRRLRQLVFGMAVVGFLVASAGPAAAQACGTTTSTQLVAGQNYVAGSIAISNDANNIYIQYHTDAPWVISDAHAAVASTLSGIPQTKTSNPIPGRFAYSATFDPETTDYTFVVPMAGSFVAGQSVFVAAHAQVQAPKASGGSQTGWGFGPGFAGNNWATYVNYTVQSCRGGGTI